MEKIENAFSMEINKNLRHGDFVTILGAYWSQLGSDSLAYVQVRLYTLTNQHNQEKRPMTIINFPKARIMPVLKAAIDRQQPIHFVKDDGIYCIVPGEIDPFDGVVAYGSGYDPNKDDWYEKAQAAVGGDDFGEDMDFRELYAKLIAHEDKWKTFRVHVTKTQLKVSVK